MELEQLNDLPLGWQLGGRLAQWVLQVDGEPELAWYVQRLEDELHNADAHTGVRAVHLHLMRLRRQIAARLTTVQVIQLDELIDRKDWTAGACETHQVRNGYHVVRSGRESTETMDRPRILAA